MCQCVWSGGYAALAVPAPRCTQPGATFGCDRLVVNGPHRCRGVDQHASHCLTHTHTPLIRMPCSCSAVSQATTRFGHPSPLMHTALRVHFDSVCLASECFKGQHKLCYTTPAHWPTTPIMRLAVSVLKTQPPLYSFRSVRSCPGFGTGSTGGSQPASRYSQPPSRSNRPPPAHSPLPHPHPPPRPVHPHKPHRPPLPHQTSAAASAAASAASAAAASVTRALQLQLAAQLTLHSGT